MGQKTGTAGGIFAVVTVQPKLLTSHILHPLKTMEEKFKSLRKLIETKTNFAITTHINPDGDAIGSSLALYHFLKNIGKQVIVAGPNDAPENLRFLPEFEVYQPFTEYSDNLTRALKNADVVFALDFNTLSRTGEAMKAVLADVTASKVLIDHHLQPDQEFNLAFSDSTSCSTCELLFDVLDGAFSHINWLTKDIAECLYTGIVTDSGSFRFDTVKPETHRKVARLLDTGFNHTAVHEYLYDSNSLERFKLMTIMLSNLRVILDGVVSVSYITECDLQATGCRREDVEGFSNMGLSLKGVVISAFMREEDGKIRISFRSKGDHDVNLYARKYFNGGGHKNAAGGTFYGSVAEALQLFEQTVHEAVLTR
jgi:phosphoesterase RecJ-like protein